MKHVKQSSILTEKSVPLETYSIGLFSGSSPFDLKDFRFNINPILSRASFSNEAMNFVADPFAIYEADTWYLFFEAMSMDNRQGKLYVCESSDLNTWSKPKLILSEPFHLSYPQVFKYKGTYYMLPETHESESLRLYKADSFPLKWSFVNELMSISCVDSTVYVQDDIVYIFVCDSPHEHNSLRLFYAEDLLGAWKEHPDSPIYRKNSTDSRPAGKLFEHNNRVYRVSQNCHPFYGHSVNAFEVQKLNTETYMEIKLEQNPLLKGRGYGWNKVSMHHIDLHKIDEDSWIAFVDGRRN